MLFNEYPATKKEAKKLGILRYYTGIPCKRGHLSLRRTSGGCLDCEKISRDKNYKLAKESGYSRGKQDYDRKKRNSLNSKDPWLKEALIRCRFRAKRDNCKCVITINSLRKLAVDYCPVLGLKLDYSLGNKIARENSPSVDKINPNLGYTKNNTIIISFKANTIKQNASSFELMKVAEFFNGKIHS